MTTENLLKIQEDKNLSNDLMKIVFDQAALLNARDEAIAQYKDDIDDNIKIFKQNFIKHGISIKDFNQMILIARKSEVVYNEMQANEIMLAMADQYIEFKKNMVNGS